MVDPDAQADLSLRWVHTNFVGFVMSWLILRFSLTGVEIHVSIFLKVECVVKFKL